MDVKILPVACFLQDVALTLSWGGALRPLHNGPLHGFSFSFGVDALLAEDRKLLE
jgi:hypothetical protein